MKLEPARKVVAVTVRINTQTTAPADDESADNPCAPRALPPVGDGTNISLIGGRPAMSDEDRHLVLVFDNSYSTLRPKTVLYRVQIGSPEVRTPGMCVPLFLSFCLSLCYSLRLI